MSRRDPAVAIRHMLEHAREAMALVEGKSRSDLTKTRLLELALVRLVETNKRSKRQARAVAYRELPGG